MIYSRKKFLKFLGLSGFISFLSYLGLRKISESVKTKPNARISGANFKTGHLLREAMLSDPKTVSEIGTIIVGGGVSGLSAGWYFQKNNYSDFLVLELDDSVGGNSRSGKNSISKYPYGAHYVPLPGKEAKYVRELFEDIGIILKYQNKLPVYNEFYLCADPQERLLFQGIWQEGLVPARGIPESDRNQLQQFFNYVESLKNKIGRDGKRIFVIPLELSSQDAEFVGLDKISMQDFMLQKGWNSKYLNWYVEYCCRDDYGVSHTKVSAWAGLHYFCSRTSHAANADSQTVLTWPEGNGFLVQHLRDSIPKKIRTNCLVYRIESRNDKGYTVDVMDTENKTTYRFITQNVIYAAPRFTAQHVIVNYLKNGVASRDYTPWLVANVSLNQKPKGNGASLSWDNVSFYSRSLGYIVANHQDLNMNQKETVITYYLPLDGRDPKWERKHALEKDLSTWTEEVKMDLEKMHPGISKDITDIDLWIWGHGMVNPGIHFLWSEERKKLLKNFHGIEFAHSEMSGVSIFEEAQYRGCEAAKKILNKR